MTETHPLLGLQALGQSPWLDNIERSLLTSGRLAAMVADGDITGLTSNPTIFEKAIAGSAAYDEELADLARQGKTALEIFDALAIADIQGAADAFAGVYSGTDGRDGYVSIEVAPNYAHNSEETLREARRLWAAVDRPNLMIKIPATAAGLPAIEAAIADGINVNVTLIFSIQRYGEVMAAYIAGLRQRVAVGAAVERVASVASFFVSRLDSLIDKQLQARMAAEPGAAADLEGLLGQAAVANTRMAYQAFKAVVSAEFGDLQAAGAQMQRPLWASTSTKNPNYPDLLYVDNLIGPNTVNTMPPATLVAFKDHGTAALTVENDLDAARAVLDKIEEAGISLEAAFQQLEDEGVAAFFKSFETLLAVIETRRVAALEA